jgi:trehalose 6-phosphate phosphatase
MVVEVLPAAANKGTAIGAFMQMSPFAGRRPVFVGDDVTDEDGFAVVNALHGISVRIGVDSGSAARWQVTNVSELRAWLRAAIHSQHYQEEPPVE